MLVSNSAEPHLGGNIHYGDTNTYCPAVWDYVISRFAVKSVLDLGCGEGYSAAYFASKGCTTIAVDGLLENCRNAVYPTVLFDLTKGSFFAQVELVHCQEVVEHIEEKYIDNLLNSLTCGNILLMTHALPNQPGYHHVNLQPPEYWVDKLLSKNFHLLVEETNRVRQLATRNEAIYMAQSGLLFVKKKL
jgi:2-polyprenyl-3-methyl-5-hydroxy-6-metoxy-1,4-benzoquinol methylase